MSTMSDEQRMRIIRAQFSNDQQADLDELFALSGDLHTKETLIRTFGVQRALFVIRQNSRQGQRARRRERFNRFRLWWRRLWA